MAHLSKLNRPVGAGVGWAGLAWAEIKLHTQSQVRGLGGWTERRDPELGLAPLRLPFFCCGGSLMYACVYVRVAILSGRTRAPGTILRIVIAFPPLFFILLVKIGQLFGSSCPRPNLRPLDISPRTFAYARFLHPFFLPRWVAFFTPGPVKVQYALNARTLGYVLG